MQGECKIKITHHKKVRGRVRVSVRVTVRNPKG